MNLERPLWNEDPTKAWMKDQQCPNIRRYLKQTAFPSIEKHNALLANFFFSKDNGKRQSINPSLPVDFFTDENVSLGWQFRFEILTKPSLFIPKKHFMYGLCVPNIIDVETELLGEGDIVFNVQVFFENEKKISWLYFTPTHVEEACFIMREGILKANNGLSNKIITIDKIAWERLGMMNPFRMYDV